MAPPATIEEPDMTSMGSNIAEMDVSELPTEHLSSLAVIYMEQTFSHYGIWLSQAALELGSPSAAIIEHTVSKRYFPRIIDRLYPFILPPAPEKAKEFLSNLEREDLLLIIEALAKTWLTGDGLWFQTIENEFGMETAKKINDSSWSVFAPIEATRLKSFLNLAHEPGLIGLDAALKLRIYSCFNSHLSELDDDGALIFRMLACRVQSVRRQKGLEDYPCQSAGEAEYSGFASVIDPRIKTTCLMCPPQIVPDQGFCVWRFSI